MNNEPKFTALVDHSESTINSFTRAQFNIYGKKQRRIMLLLTVILLAAAVLLPFGDVVSALLLFAACLIFVDLGHIPKRTAAAMIKQMPEFDSYNYSFGEKSVIISSKKSGASGTVAYSKLQCIAEDSSYFYFFTAPATGYMFSKSSLNPSDRDKFKIMLSSASGCNWSSAKGIMGINLFSIIQAFKKK